MSLRFSQTFFALLALSFFSAFVLPERLTDLGRTQFEALLIPISRPTYKIATEIHAHFVHEAPEDTRPSETIEQENLVLRQQVQLMSAEIDRLAQRANERARLGGFEQFCSRYEVAGTDADNHDGITITGSGLSAVQLGQPVLSSGTVVNLIGVVDRVGSLAAHVTMVTDTGFTVTGHFFSVSAGGASENTNLIAIVRGQGYGNRVINTLPFETAKKSVHVGDWVVLADDRWPQLHGIRLGRVNSIDPLPSQSLFAEIKLEHEPDITLRDAVWVMTHPQ
ncbi:MAG TPA: rod shape-determining protein MreC [Tepidisphaeraceae bacterium]|jgi:cell shape-determining protein MreC